MVETVIRAAGEWLGIKADVDDAKKLLAHLRETYGSESPEIIKRAFSTGEAAEFLTVNETYFFREPVHFTFLLDLLPSYESGLHICCAAVATGCEAYSIAMLIEAYNRLAEKPVPYHIDAFDVCPGMIEAACRGLYGANSLREDGSSLRYMAAPYLKKQENGFQADHSLKNSISFFVHNLMNKLPEKAYDLIFFRNTFIYFTAPGRERVLSNLSESLKDAGILIMGVSETASVCHKNLEAKNRSDIFYFQKTSSVYLTKTYNGLV